MKAYDELLIAFTRSEEPTEERYQATVRQRGLLVEGGPFRRRETFSAAEIRDIQQEYARTLKDFQVLTPLGLSVPPPDLRNLLALGYRVGEVLPPQTRSSLLRALARAQKHQRGLRIILEAHPDALALLSIPWELIAVAHSTVPIHALSDNKYAPSDSYEQRENDFLLLRATVALVRQVRGVGQALPLALATPLRLQAFVSQPHGEVPIDMQSVEQAVQTTGHGDTTDLYTGHGTLPAMQERLSRHTPQIVHLLCHGEHRDTGSGVRNDLILTHNDGYPHRVSVFDLAPSLSLATDLQLVILHACHSASLSSSSMQSDNEHTAADTPRIVSESIALGLLRAGIRAIVAFQGEVGQDAATAFMHTFYTQLAAGHELDQAVTEGRIAMQTAGGTVDWSLPVVYRGHEEPEPATMLTRMADRIEPGLRNPGVQQTVRAGIVALALLLLLTGIVRWVLVPDAALRLHRTTLLPLMTVWISMGVISPAIIAAAQRGVRKQIHLSSSIRQMALVAQWAGAYLGYAIWSVICLVLGVILVLLDPTGLVYTRSVQIGFLVVTIISSWFASYIFARVQVKSTLAIAPYNPELFLPWSQWILFAAALLLLGLPYSLFWINNIVGAWFMRPAPGALLLAIVMLTITHWINTDM